MDEQHVELLRDMIANVQETCQGIREDFRTHVEKDETAYKTLSTLENRVTNYERMGKGALGIAGLIGIDKIWHWFKY